MNKRWINIVKCLPIILLLLFFAPNFAFADGGIPFWILTAPSVLANLGIWFVDSPSVEGALPLAIISFIVFCVVILLEFFVLNVIFFKKEKSGKVFWITTKANFYSTLAGIVLVCLPMIFYNGIGSYDFLFLGPWCFLSGISFAIMNLLLLWISYLIEYKVAKKDLIDSYEEKKIKKAFLIANIVSYALALLLSLYTLIWTIMDTFEEYMFLYILAFVSLMIGVVVYFVYKYLKNK